MGGDDGIEAIIPRGDPPEMYLDVLDLWEGAIWYLFSSDLVLKTNEPLKDSLNCGPVGEKMPSQYLSAQERIYLERGWKNWKESNFGNNPTTMHFSDLDFHSLDASPSS